MRYTGDFATVIINGLYNRANSFVVSSRTLETVAYNFSVPFWLFFTLRRTNIFFWQEPPETRFFGSGLPLPVFSHIVILLLDRTKAETGRRTMSKADNTSTTKQSNFSIFLTWFFTCHHVFSSKWHVLFEYSHVVWAWTFDFYHFERLEHDILLDRGKILKMIGVGGGQMTSIFLRKKDFQMMGCGDFSGIEVEFTMCMKKWILGIP